MYIITVILGICTMYNAVTAAGAAAPEMTVTELAKNIVDIGITPVLLLAFVVYFIRKSRDDDRRVNAAYEEAQKKIAETNDVISQRERQLTEENARMVELIRTEAERRESLIRKESEKRESILMGNMERMVQSMEEITRSMRNIDQSFAKINERLEKIEGKVNEGLCQNK